MKIAPLFKAIQADESRRTQGPLYRPTRTNAPRQNRLRKIPHLVHRKLSRLCERNKRKARRYIVLGAVQIAAPIFLTSSSYSHSVCSLLLYILCFYISSAPIYPLPLLSISSLYLFLKIIYFNNHPKRYKLPSNFIIINSCLYLTCIFLPLACIFF